MGRQISTLREVYLLFLTWCLEVAAFTVLPLIVYLMIFLSFGRSVWEISKLPELMFIAIVLYGETLKRHIVFYRNIKQGFEQNLTVSLSLGILGVTISSVLLCLSLVAERQPAFILSELYYVVQWSFFIFAILMSAFTKIWLGVLSGEAKLYAQLKPESENEDTAGKEDTEQGSVERQQPRHELSEGE